MPPEKIAELMKKPLVATGVVSLVAEKDAEGKPVEGNKKMTITAYNGGMMKVGWGYPVGIELSGLKWREDNAVPILCQHKTYSIDAICGQATKVSHDGKTLTIDADFMPVSQDAKKVHELAKAGFKFQASVGVSASDVIFIEANQSYKLNGAEVKGECYIVRAGVLNEVSIVPLGADGSTQTAISAAANQGKEGVMPEDKNKPVEGAQPAAATVEAAQTAERERVASLITACKGHEDILAQAVKEGWTAEKAELACLKAEKEEAEKAKKQAAIEASRPGAPAIINLQASASHDAKTVVAAACMGAAMKDKDLEAQCKGVDLDAAHDLKITRLSDIFAAFGIQYRPGDNESMEKALRAAFSNANIPNVLSNVAHKFVMAGFGAVGDDWRKVSRPVSVVDFKEVKGVRLVMGGVLKPLAKGGELQHVDLSDDTRALKAATKGSIVGITREDLVNDDLSVLSLVPERFGQMSGRTINKDVFGKISTTASDYGANTTGALSLDALAAAYALAMTIKDGQGDPLGTLPDKILCSPSSFILAKGIYQSEHIVNGAGKSARDNVMRNMLEPVTSPYLSGTTYWLFNSTFPLVDVAFLNGRQTPVIETADVDFTQLGIQMRCYFDYGPSKGETKAALISTGA
ncbi:MAG: Mu-like prophage major head subunit gpT family protein [Kiritimatiellae bacterium]|nr:Mu-like prophage major head subunit gpT family protein [Kiritimatiellia bacterium]